MSSDLEKKAVEVIRAHVNGLFRAGVVPNTQIDTIQKHLISAFASFLRSEDDDFCFTPFKRACEED